MPYGLLLPLVFPGLRHFPKTALAVLATTVSIETIQATPHNSARKLSERFCASSAVLKTREYCMYFPFLERQNWRKRSGKG